MRPPMTDQYKTNTLTVDRQMWLNVIEWLGQPVRLALTRAGTAGWRYTGDLSVAAMSWATLALWGAFTRSELLVVVGLPLAVLARLVHRVRPGTGHSLDIGTSAVGGRNAECGLVAGCGFLAWLADPGAGSYLVAAAFANATVYALIAKRQDAADQDQIDAYHETTARTGRVRNRFDL